MAKKTYAAFTPARTKTHDILGRVDVYEFDSAPKSDDSGAQTDFFRNNAEANNPKQFGIKLFATSVEAFAAYQRQKLAARKRCAPPVGKMVQWKVGNWSRWGYQTCIAVCNNKHEMTVYMVKNNKEAKKIFADWLKNCAEAQHKKNPYSPASIASFRRDGSWQIIESVYARRDVGIINKKQAEEELKKDPRVGVATGGSWFRPKYSIGHIDIKGDALYRGLRSIDLTGTQYDNLWDIHDDGRFTFETDARLRLGGVWRKSDRATCGGDLHNGNIGFWKNRPVCVDFGFHCVKSSLTGNGGTSIEE